MGSPSGYPFPGAEKLQKEISRVHKGQPGPSTKKARKKRKRKVKLPGSKSLGGDERETY